MPVELAEHLELLEVVVAVVAHLLSVTRSAATSTTCSATMTSGTWRSAMSAARVLRRASIMGMTRIALRSLAR
jgi:hypothetical protein